MPKKSGKKSDGKVLAGSPAGSPTKSRARPPSDSAAKSAKAPASRSTAKKAAAKSRKSPASATTVRAKVHAAKGTKPVVAPVSRAPSKTSTKTTAKASANKAATQKTAVKPRAAPASADRPTATPAPRIKAPAFQLPRDGGGGVSLQDYAGSKLVLFFYPRADTPGCTREAIDFTRLTQAFATAGTRLLGVSADAPKAQEAFRDKHDLAMPLLSDEAKEMIRAYGAWGQKSMYGKTFDGIIRTTVLIDSSGHIARVWRHVKVDGHAEDVLEAAKML